MKRNIKPLAALAILGGVGVIGGTFAAFTSSTTLENVFKTASYKMTTVENFTSPEDWKPGDTTPKTLVTTNDGSVDALVRIKMTESWYEEDGVTPLTDVPAGTVTINMANEGDWTKDGDYYVYNNTLAAGESTTTPIESVTLNNAVGLPTDGTGDCVTTPGTGTTTIVCTEAGSATYKLDILVETVQADQGWN